jgi:hypothetical protein
MRIPSKRWSDLSTTAHNTPEYLPFLALPSIDYLALRLHLMLSKGFVGGGWARFRQEFGRSISRGDSLV